MPDGRGSGEPAPASIDGANAGQRGTLLPILAPMRKDKIAGASIGRAAMMHAAGRMAGCNGRRSGIGWGTDARTARKPAEKPHREFAAPVRWALRDGAVGRRARFQFFWGKIANGAVAISLRRSQRRSRWSVVDGQPRPSPDVRDGRWSTGTGMVAVDVAITHRGRRDVGGMVDGRRASGIRCSHPGHRCHSPKGRVAARQRWRMRPAKRNTPPMHP